MNAAVWPLGSLTEDNSLQEHKEASLLPLLSGLRFLPLEECHYGDCFFLRGMEYPADCPGVEPIQLPASDNQNPELPSLSRM